MSVSATLESTGFHRFELHEALVRGLKSAGFENPRPIQDETIPAGLEGIDVLGLAQTGTGKTAAFALPLLEWILNERPKAPAALILAPTRELANQIAVEIRMLAKFTRVRVVTVYGGVSMRNQANELRRNPEIVVGCPGRVLDMLQQGVLKLGAVGSLVLDEADHMFDMGFLPDVRKIIDAIPRDRQSLLFSATMPKEIRRLADDLLVDPHVVDLAGTCPAETIDHGLYRVAEKRKRALLEHLLDGEDCQSAIVFTRTKHRARRLADQLSKGGYRAVALQGNMSQSQRDRAMKGFRDRRFDILVATDIAARGIDVSGISHVINFDVPNTPEAYTHRIGRTGRAELEGVACTFVTGEDLGWVRATERMIGEAIQRREIAGFETGVENEERTPRKSSPRSRPGGNARGARRGRGGQGGNRRRSSGRRSGN